MNRGRDVTTAPGDNAPKRKSKQEVAYDIGINVIANLIAAGIVAALLQATGVITLPGVFTVIFLSPAFAGPWLLYKIVTDLYRTYDQNPGVVAGGINSIRVIAALSVIVGLICTAVTISVIVDVINGGLAD